MVDGMMRQSDYKNVVWNQNPMETFLGRGLNSTQKIMW